MKVPVFVLTGFLGSGKTTLLNELLQFTNKENLKAAVLMNELGTLDVDGNILKSEHNQIALEKLIDGCMCCSKKSEIPTSLNILLKQQPDVIFIELTGVANPDEIVDALTEPECIDQFDLQWIITLLDAEHVMEYNSIFHSDKLLIHTLRRQIQSADLLVVNKTDRITDRMINKIDKMLKKNNPGAQIIFTTQAAIDHQPLFNRVSSRKIESPTPTRRTAFKVLNTAKQTDDIEVRKSFSRLETISFRIMPEMTLSKEDINSWIHAHRKQIIRAKGFMKPMSDDKPMMMQYSGGHIVWQPTNYQGDPFIVLIGFDIDNEAVISDWKERTENRG
jgi:G3E family GTPase